MKRTKEAKIYEALSAIIDKRVVEIDKNTYHVLSSDHSKYYTVINEGDLYTSNDNATYWQHYAGYPISGDDFSRKAFFRHFYSSLLCRCSLA